MSEFPGSDNPFKTPESGKAPMSSGDRDAALRRLGPPAVIILILSIIYVVWSAITPFVATAMNDMMVDVMMNMMPDEESKETFLEQMEAQQNSGLQAISNWAGAIIGVVVALITAFGAWKMKTASSYGWAMAACILSIIPGCSACCLLSMPVGIWGLVVLLNQEVKAAFPQK